MKTINRLFAAALVLFVAAACYNKEIESPDNRQDPETQDISEQTRLKITASIIQTRVIYNDNDNDLSNRLLEQVWEVGDILFGFIDNANHTPVVLQVYDITNGVATLVPTTGGDALSVMDENTYVNLIYTGGNPLTLSENSYTVDMSSQSGKIPACMHASAKKRNDALEFHFVNDCAIFEIVSLTGVAEDHGSDSQALNSITVSNVFTSGQYTFSEGGNVSFSGVSGEVDDVTITLGDGWIIDDSGTIKNDGAAQPVLIAVAPKTADENASITITAEADNNIHYGYDFGSKSIEAKKCYVVSAKPIVAKTEDGQYFKTVYDAFKHAEYLDGNPSLLQGRTNTVTLLVDEIDGLGDQDDPAYDKPITIGYDVTLDLNGCFLELSGTETFTVQSNGEFTVTDFTEDCSGGTISSTGKAISNDGKVIINGGTITSVVKSAIGNSGSLTVNAGTVSSEQSSAIYSDGYEIIIGQTGSPIISSPNNNIYEECYYSNGEEQHCAAIFIEYFDEDNATFTMYGGTVTGNGHAIAMNGPVEAEIYGGNFSSSFRTLLVADGAQCNISGGQFYCSSTEDPTVYCFCEDKTIKGTSLTITECEDNDRKEPLFYSVAETDEYGRNIMLATPICATLNGNDRINYSSVTIEGGYYYSNGAFLYFGNDDVLTIPSGATLYSNVNRIGYRDDRGGVKDYTISSSSSSFSVSFFALKDKVEFTYKLTQ